MREYHLLKVENAKGSSTYHLNASTIIIGRKTLSGIKVDDEKLMAHHAVLRKIYTTGLSHAFTLIVGSGQVHTFNHGHWHEKQKLHRTLVTGDKFQLGDTVFSYLTAFMSESDYAQYFNAQPVLLESSKPGNSSVPMAAKSCRF